MGEAAIIVDDLAKSYGAVVALEGIGFEVAPGTVTGLLGPTDRARPRRWRSSPPRFALIGGSPGCVGTRTSCSSSG